MDFVDFDN